MIGLFIKIPFHSQLRAAEPRLAAELSSLVDEAVAAFAASRFAIEESFLLTFEESSRPCRLRAAEAARALVQRLSALGPRLHGWALILDAGAANSDETLLSAKRLWLGISGDGLYVSPRSRAYFSDYFLFEKGAGKAPGEESREPASDGEYMGIPVLDAIYARPALPLRDVIEEAPALVLERLVETLRTLAEGTRDGPSLAILGPGMGPRLCVEAALSRLYGSSSPRFLRLGASAVEEAPYGPIAGAFAALLPAKDKGAPPTELLPSKEAPLLEELAPMLDFLRRSPFRRGCSPQIDTRLRLCLAAALRYYARRMRASGLPALLILRRTEVFPEASVALILSLASESREGESLTIIAEGADLPASWTGQAPRSFEVPGPSPRALAQAALRCAEAIGNPGAGPSLALAAAGDPQRLRLALRVLTGGRRLDPPASTQALAAQALSSLPREYAELLLALRLGEENLTDEAMEGFLRDSGYIPGIREPICECLADLGFISRGWRPRIASLQAALGAEGALEDGGVAVHADFAIRLRLLRERGAIIPSAALYRRMSSDPRNRVEDGPESSALALDCISADLVYGPSEPAETRPLGSPLAPLTDFLRASEALDRAGSRAALELLEARATALGAGGELAAAVTCLARASFEYAEGRPQSAATKAKKALMGLHSLGLRKAEARAHRVLGLCSLAQEQVQEGADYLANAYELAASLPEALECILSSTAEAAAYFSLGDLGKAAQRAEAGAVWAASCFRADWESACTFIRGRAALEIGRCAEAEEDFERVKVLARVYGQAEALKRSEIWTGRAAAFAGEAARARRILGGFSDDLEALWFLAELEAWDGDFGRAAVLADEALTKSAPAAFCPSELFDWGSGFASLEGRAVGFFGRRSYLVDQVGAFREFAAGMAEPESSGLACASRLEALAREDRLATIHPSAHLYLFYRYLILERVTPSSMDGASAISKAFKALQLRSTRMGEASLKDGFLEANRWNRALIQAARARKLI